ncbi:MAG TPA: ABC transporter permease [Allosphingosinicella sp.]
MKTRAGRLASRIGVNLAIALTALRVNLMRSILTTLGVSIGVFAVVLAVAVGTGAQVSVMQAINSLGSNMAIVFPFPDNVPGRRPTDRGRLTMRDANAILRQVDGISAIAPQLRAQVQVVSGGRSASTEARGATPGFGTVSNLTAETGRFLSDADVRTGARVAVIGETVADKLFGDFEPLGETIRVNKVPFTVIGVLEAKGSSLGEDSDDRIIIPISAARQRFTAETVGGPDDLHVLSIGIEDGVSLKTAKRDITRVLRERYRVRGKDANPFTVRTTEEFMEETSTVTGIFQAVLVAIASISLLVGGIGIMNIMLVSVTERTREIGLRMALGAKRSDIRNQFLVEAAVLCMIGGATGLLLAIFAASIFEAQADFPVPIGVATSVGAILFSGAIGLLFGGWPAIRASRLSPIEALRTE